jgi:hypothetical protein
MATVTHTQISSPGDPYYSIANQANATETRTVTGTSDGTTGDVVDLRCYSNDTYWWPDPGQDIPVQADGSFSGDVDLFDISNDGAGCTLRAVPDNTGPGDTSSFKGPRMLITYWQGPESQTDQPVHGGGTVKKDEYSDFEGTNGRWYLYELTDDPLYEGAPTNPATLYNPTYYQSEYTIDSGADLRTSNQEGDANSLQVDGQNAYTLQQLPRLDYDGGGPEGTTYPQGVSSFEASIAQDDKGNVTISESYPLYRCADNTVYPPTVASCPTVSSAGVRLDRKKVSSDGGATFAVSDTFVSTDGGQHSVRSDYRNESSTWYTNYIDYRMPGEETGSVRLWGDVFQWQSAPGTMFWYDQADNTSVGAGALTELQKPEATTWNSYYEWYQRFEGTTVPAGGSTTLDHIYQVAFHASDIEALAAAKTDPLGAPQVAITSPADNTLTQQDAVLVTGTAADNVGVKSLTVNGTPTVVGGDGKWSQTVLLNEGENTITAVATDGSGQSSQASLKVIRGASACKVPTLTGVTKDQAVAALNASGCGVGTQKSVFSGKVKSGSVVAQAAAPGTLLVAGTKVDFSVSRGAFPSARLASSKVTLKGSRLILSVRCAKTGSATNGTIKLRKVSGKHQTLGTRSFQCPSGKARNVIFTFSAKTARALHKANKTRLNAYIVSRGPGGGAATRRSTITVLG